VIDGSVAAMSKVTYSQAIAIMYILMNAMN